MTNERINKIKSVFEQHTTQIIKTSTLRENQICSRDIAELIALGFIIKIKTGYYAWDSDFENLQDFEVIQNLIPNGVISMLSAAQVHDLTTVNSMNIMVTIPLRMMKPQLPQYPPVDIYFSADKNMELGIVNYQMDHMTVRIYNKERTVCDLFKYSSRVENDVALDVLKAYMDSRDKNLQLLFEYANQLRVKKYIKPYVEALLR